MASFLFFFFFFSQFPLTHRPLKMRVLLDYVVLLTSDGDFNVPVGASAIDVCRTKK